MFGFGDRLTRRGRVRSICAPMRFRERPSARAIRMLMAAALAMASLGPFPGQVSADHGGRPIGSLFSCDRPVTPPRCTSVGDGPRHLVYFDESLTDELASSLRDSMAEDYGATKLVVIEQSRLTRMTDVIAFSRDYGDNGAAGWVNCPRDAPQGFNPSGARWCRHQELHLNLNARYAVFFADDASRDHVVCHEMGHTLGLRHWGNPPQTSGTDVGATCMNANTPNGPTTLHQVDIDHINGYSYRQRPSWRHVPLGPVPDRGRVNLMPWSGTLEPTEIEDPASLRELARSADAVVRGEVVSVAPGRVFGEPGSDALHYAAATLRVDDLIAGEVPSRQVTLEIPLFDGPESIDVLPVWGEGVFFLRHKAEGEFHRLVTFDSLVVNEGGVALTDTEAPLLSGLAGAPFEDVVELIRQEGCIPAVC
jgi:hypothetical protein